MKVTIAQIVEALRATGGRQQTTAERLGVTHQALSGRIKRNKRLQTELESIRRRHLETAEGNVLRSLYSGDEKVSRWYLERQGKAQGWSARTELTGPDNTPVAIDFGLEHLDEAAIADLARRLGPPDG